MAREKYIIDKSDLTALLKGEDLAIQPKGKIRGFCVEITGNLTNGDMIKAMFPNSHDWEATIEGESSHYLELPNNLVINRFTEDWWNALYKVGGEIDNGNDI